jgi:hypothetical protein
MCVGGSPESVGAKGERAWGEDVGVGVHIDIYKKNSSSSSSSTRRRRIRERLKQKVTEKQSFESVHTSKSCIVPFFSAFSLSLHVSPLSIVFSLMSCE